MDTNQLHIIIVFLEYILVAFYALIGYKKPHGNILKYTLFAFVLLCMYEFLMPGRPATSNIEYIANACIGLASVLIAYMSGRLNRVDQNKVIMSVVGVLFVASIEIKSIWEPATAKEGKEIKEVSALAKAIAEHKSDPKEIAEAIADYLKEGQQDDK